MISLFIVLQRPYRGVYIFTDPFEGGGGTDITFEQTGKRNKNGVK